MVAPQVVVLIDGSQTKAREDHAEVLATVRSLEKRSGRSSSLQIDEKEVELFCKGAAHISLVRGRPFKIVQPESTVPVQLGDRAKYFRAQLTNAEGLAGLYVAFLAWDEYVATHSLQAPGASGELEGDTDKLTGIAHKYVDSIINEAGSRIEDPEYTEIKQSVGKYCQELARAGGAELHNIASLSGGLIAQEVIKVITKQYVPIDNTCLFDGVSSRTHILRI